MSAYIIVEVDVKDPVRYEDYKKLTPASIAAYGGKFIVRGGKTELIEGNQEPKRIVILEFENAEKAKQWWNSPEYRDAKKLRHATAESRMILVEGV
ncbi:MAG TPA: DUF1330 domain-containing protein [Ignavibacteriaceae bacterium]|nr:DUF1330 domain-containing protein [Ignavibacteriaceae bacterium]